MSEHEGIVNSHHNARLMVVQEMPVSGQHELDLIFTVHKVDHLLYGNVWVTEKGETKRLIPEEPLGERDLSVHQLKRQLTRLLVQNLNALRRFRMYEIREMTELVNVKIYQPSEE